MHTIYGNYNDSIGIMLAGHFSKNTGYPVTGPYTAIGWINKGELVGQCIFNDYTEANIEIHLYLPRYFTRRTIKDVYNYVFNILKCERLTAKPYCSNQKLLQLLERIGFEYEFTQKDYYKYGEELIDAVVYKLTKKTIPSWAKLNA